MQSGFPSLRVDKITVTDVRFPTSTTGEGTDAVHTNCNYSAGYLNLFTTDLKTKKPGPTAHSIIFTIGKGNDVAAKVCEDLAYIVQGHTLEEIVMNFPVFLKRLANEPQLRWLGPEKGVVHLATSGIVNAIWDLWGKAVHKPLWQLLCDLSAEEIVSLLEFTYIEDQFTKEEALAILKKNESTRGTRVKKLQKEGFPAYTTATGWSGYSEEKVRGLVKHYKKEGFTRFKVKVGLGVQVDYKRCQLIRDCIGPDCTLMMDANQVWTVEEAITSMNRLKDFNPLWIEEPTAPDDVLGHVKISKAIAPIGVATGEHAHNRILHKHFAVLGGYQFCQADICRLGGMNELILVMLMAKKFNIPVCLHSGGVGLCEMGVHAAIFDYVCISASQEKRIFEHSGALHEHFESPVVIKKGAYVLPTGIGYTADIKPESVSRFTYPSGEYWAAYKFQKSYKLCEGLFCPTFTPMTADGLSLNLGLVKSFAQHLVANGTNGIWLNGTSGQYASLSLSEKKAIVTAWMNTKEVKSGALTVISHVGSNSLVDSLELAKFSAEKGAYAIAIIAPSYFKPASEPEIAKWIAEVAKSVPLTPVFYYHIPSMNGVNSQVNRVLSLARDISPNVVGCKFTDSRLDDLNLCVAKGFNVLVGSDTLFLAALYQGAHGIVCTGLNFNGKQYKAIYDGFKEQRKQEAKEIQKKIAEMFVEFSNIDVIKIGKWLMGQTSGIDMGPTRLPKGEVTESEAQLMRERVLNKYLKE